MTAAPTAAPTISTTRSRHVTCRSCSGPRTTERELAELFDFDYFTHWLGRRFCSALLLRMLTPHDWHDAARYLDLPEQFVNDRYHRIFTALGANGRLDELARRVKRIANQHAQDGLIDYQQRRALLADWGGIDIETWYLLQPRPRPIYPPVDGTCPCAARTPRSGCGASSPAVTNAPPPSSCRPRTLPVTATSSATCCHRCASGC